MTTPRVIRNTTWAELKIGDSATVERVCAQQDLMLFAHVSGNVNPLTLPPPTGETSEREPLAPSMWIGSLISAVLGNVLPGPGTLYRSQSLEFGERVRVGDKLKVTIACCDKFAEPSAAFDARIINAETGAMVCRGVALVDAPTRRIEAPERDIHPFIIDAHDHFSRLIDLAAQLPPLRTAVVCPEDFNSLGGVVLAVARGLIAPTLIGHPKRISAAAADLHANITNWRVVDVPDHRAAAARAVEMVRAGEADAIMKGAVHSDELLAAVVKKEGGLRTARRVTHVFALDVPTLDELLFISDAAINIAPDLLAKVDIVQNAIDIARACGLDVPRVGVLSAVETITPSIPSTIDAAALSKMVDRGQITGGVVDGPLAMDNAIDIQAARTKGIASLVAGRANVLIVPNIEAGNMLSKELVFVAHAEAAGLVLGAQVPVMLTSRADNDKARLVSCALAQLYAFWRREGRAFDGADAAPAVAAE